MFATGGQAPLLEDREQFIHRDSGFVEDRAKSSHANDFVIRYHDTRGWILAAQDYVTATLTFHDEPNLL
jgi:hypothetical protein